MKWIGLTGGIATGKSETKKLVQGLGVPVIDADELARRVVEPGHVGYDQVVSQFGTAILTADKTLNREALGEIVFKSIEKRAALEAIIHPLIQSEVLNQRQSLKEAGHQLCFYDVPLLFEKKLKTQFFKTVLVWCDERTQLERLKLRNNYSEEQAIVRIKSQVPLIEKLPLADFCLDNSTTRESLKLQVNVLIDKLKQMSSF